MSKHKSCSKRPAADLKRRYKRTLEFSFILSLSLLIVLFYSFKKFELETVLVPSIPDDFDVVNIPPTKQSKPKPRPPLPQIPVPAEVDDILDDITIENTGDLSLLSLGDAPPPPEPEPDSYEFFAVSQKPKLTRRVEPKYPPLAIRAGIEGMVVTKVLINEQGDVADVEVLKSIPMLDDAAVAAAWQCRFKPGKQRDKFVKVWMSVPFVFKLRNAR